MSKLDKQGLSTFVQELDKHINTKINRLGKSPTSENVTMNDGTSVEDAINANKTSILTNTNNIGKLTTKVDNGQNFKLTTDGGAYIRINIDATEDERNLDNKFAGWYDIYNCTGTLPSDLSADDNNVFLEVKRRSNDYCIQYLYDVRTTRSWVRNRNKGVWKTWVSIQNHKLTNDNGTSIEIHGSDLNTVTKSGNYVGNNWVNAPSKNYAIVEVVQGTSGMVKQVFTETTSTNQYMRIYRSSTWTNWREL